MINRFLNIKFVTLNIVFLLFFTNITNALTDAKIVFKIDNEIVTNFDIDQNEMNRLMTEAGKLIKDASN